MSLLIHIKNVVFLSKEEWGISHATLNAWRIGAGRNNSHGLICTQFHRGNIRKTHEAAFFPADVLEWTIHN